MDVAASGRAFEIHQLLRRGARPNYLAYQGAPSPLLAAAANCNLDTVKALLEGAADVNFRQTVGEDRSLEDLTPLMVALD